MKQIIDFIRLHKLGVIVAGFITLITVASLVKFEIESQNQRVQKMEAERIAQEQKDAALHAAGDIFLNGVDLFYREYVKLGSDSPDYYKTLAEADSSYDVRDGWSATEQAEIQAVIFLQEDVVDVTSKCDESDICKSSASKFLLELKRAASLHLDALNAWKDNDSLVGNKLFGEANEQLDLAEKDIKSLYMSDAFSFAIEQTDRYISLSSDAFSAVSDNYILIDSYCGIIDPMFHQYARYKNMCGSSDTGSYIKLDTVGSYYFRAPIKFNGRVSANTNKIVVTAKYGGKEDVYVLKDYTPGQLSFQYQAAEEWNNLAAGSNTYYFVATFEDGTTSTAETTVMYYPSVGYME